MSQGREGGVVQSELDELPLPGRTPLALRRENACDRREASDDVPNRHDVIDRTGVALRAGHKGESCGGVDGVIERYRAVAIAGDVGHDEVGTARLQPFEIQPTPRR